MTQSFFAVMGGYALRPSGSKTLFRIDGYRFYTLIKDGTIPLPRLSTSEILDRSKGDWLAKMVVCLQIFWLLVQLVGRAIQHLPITTLELFTLGLALCGLITYGFWWYKPLDIQKPTIIEILVDGASFQDIIWLQTHAKHID